MLDRDDMMEMNSGECPECGPNAGQFMGILGMLHWYSCRYCGLVFNHRNTQGWRDDDDSVDI